jgi:hypothetical protein
MEPRDRENSMADDIDWAAHFREADAFREKKLIEATKNRNGAERDFAKALLAAHQGMVQDGLVPERTQEMETRYTTQQGLMAAAHGRQDAAATLLIQYAVLHRLDSLRQLAWVAIGLLTYIAIRVTI